MGRMGTSLPSIGRHAEFAESASVIGAARLCGLARELRVLCRAGRHDAVSELATPQLTAAASATSVALRCLAGLSRFRSQHGRTPGNQDHSANR